MSSTTALLREELHRCRTANLLLRSEVAGPSPAPTARKITSLRLRCERELEEQREKCRHAKPTAECSREELAERFYAQDMTWDRTIRFYNKPPEEPPRIEAGPRQRLY